MEPKLGGTETGMQPAQPGPWPSLHVLQSRKDLSFGIYFGYNIAYGGDYLE